MQTVIENTHYLDQLQMVISRWKTEITWQWSHIWVTTPDWPLSYLAYFWCLSVPVSVCPSLSLISSLVLSKDHYTAVATWMKWKAMSTLRQVNIDLLVTYMVTVYWDYMACETLSITRYQLQPFTNTGPLRCVKIRDCWSFSGVKCCSWYSFQ